MILASHGIIGSQIVQFSGLLDTYTGAAAAYSLRLLRTAYTGSAIKVRRASDNTEQDIGFSNNELDTTSLASFCSGTNGFVTTWYDQSGNGNNATQTTAAAQPKIYDSSTGVITENGKSSVQYDGSDDILSANNFNLNSSVFLCSCVATLTDLTGINNLIDADPNPPRLSQIIRTNADIPETIGFNASTVTVDTNTAISTNTQYLFSSEYTSSNITLYVNNSSDGSATITGNNTGIINLTIGGRKSTTTSSSDSKIQEVIFYLSDQSSNRTGIETNINDFYSIY